MSTGPTNYVKSKYSNRVVRQVPLIDYIYYDKNNPYDNRFQKWIQYNIDGGLTYISNLGYRIPSVSLIRSSGISGITNWDPNYQILNKFNYYNPSRNLCETVSLFFNIFAIQSEGLSSAGSSSNFFTDDLESTTSTSVFYTPWPDKGISLWGNAFKNFLDASNAMGITIDSFIGDYEGIPFPASNTRAVDAIRGSCLYFQSWRGLSSWNELYTYYGGQTFISASNVSSEAWNMVAYKYAGKAINDAYVPYLQQQNPNAAVANYADIDLEVLFPSYSKSTILQEDGAVVIRNGPWGNASSPVMYGFARQAAAENYPALNILTTTVSYNNPTLINPTYGGYSDSYLDKFVTYGPWFGFLMDYGQLVAAKVKNPNAPLLPWIGSPYMLGDSAQYRFIFQRPSEWLPGSSQIPAEVMHNRWNYSNISSVNQITGASFIGGSTIGYLAVSDQTANEKLLGYYYNGLTSGVTYVFSYYIDLSRGYTAGIQKIENFRKNPYSEPQGITYIQTLPVSTGPFFGTGPIDYGGACGWTRVQFKFNLPSPDPLDPMFNPTFVGSVYNNLTNNVTGPTQFYFGEPMFEIESSPENIGITMLSVDSADNDIRWHYGPPNGYGDVIKGYNPRTAFYSVRRGGNSAYFYELVTHACLRSSRALAWFNNSEFTNNADPVIRKSASWGNDLGSVKRELSLKSGFTGFMDSFTRMNETLKDVHEKIGGFTTASANTGRLNYLLPYVASGAPDTKGQTWWWRITKQPGYTLYINGITMNDVGMWLPLSGSCFAGVNVTWTEPIPPPEPNLPAPVRDFNFYGMTGLQSLVSNGFNYTRGSSGSYINSSGHVAFVGINQPRFEYDVNTKLPRGLLLEPPATNLLNWSETFATTGGIDNNWVDTNITRQSGFTSPSNLLNAIRFTANTSNATIISSKSNGIGTRSLSCWFKGISGNEQLYFTIDGGTSWTQVQNLNTSWKRFAYGPFFDGITNIHLNYIGFKLGNTNDSVEMWGVQLENTRQTSYIPTAGASASRSGDQFLMSGISFSSWFGFTYGTMVFEQTNPCEWVLAGTTTSLRLSLMSESPQYNERRSGSPFIDDYFRSSWSYPTRVMPYNTPVKWLVGWTPQGKKVACGTKVSIKKQTASPTVFPDIGALYIGVFGLSNTPLEPCNIGRLRFWNRSFDEQTIKQITSGGVTMIGWLNNGDGDPPEAIIYV